MFFIASKVLGFFALPSNLLISLGLLGLALRATRFKCAGGVLVAASLLLLAGFGLSPIGNALILPLEERFPPWAGAGRDPDGIVILGGAVTPDVSAARDGVALNEGAERLTVIAALASRYPRARIVFSGGSPDLLAVQAAEEAEFAVRLLEEFGVARERIIAENRARNTIENALFSKDAARPQAGERWVLVTSAYHMPRAIGVFRRAGFPVEAFPVDWRTRGSADLTRPFATVGDGLRRTDTAVREWIGLLAYRISGHTSELFPQPLAPGRL